MRPEIKLDDNNSGIITFGASGGAVVAYAPVEEGSAQNERIGNKILVTSIHSAFDFGMDQMSVNDCEIVSVSVVVDRRTVEGAIPVTNDVYENATLPLAFLNSRNVGRFSVIWTRTFNLDKRNRQTRQFKMNHRFAKGLVVQFAGPTGSDVSKNVIFVVFRSGGTIANPTFVLMRNRLRYTDS